MFLFLFKLKSQIFDFPDFFNLCIFFHASQEALKNPEENVDGRKNHTK